MRKRKTLGMQAGLGRGRLWLRGRASLTRRALIDRRAAAAVEFGLIAVPFIAILIAILETSLVFFAQQVLDTSAEKSVRQMITGQAQRANMTQAQFKTAVCATLPSFMTCDNVMIDVRTATTFSDASTSPAVTYDKSGEVKDNWAYTPGGAGAINVVTIMYVWDTQIGLLDFDLSNLQNGKRLLVSTSVFKTEPYI